MFKLESHLLEAIVLSYLIKQFKSENSIPQRNENQLTNYLADLNESVSKKITAQKPALGLRQVLFHRKAEVLRFQGGIQKDSPGKANPTPVPWEA